MKPLEVDRLLRRLASLLVRGPAAPHVLGDLDEAIERELARGVPPGRARLRYLRNATASGLSLASARVARLARRLPSVPVSPLDVKLGFRMLIKHPGLTGVAVFALGLGIPTSLWPFHVLNILESTLPFHEGERIVGLRHSTGSMEAGDGTLHAYAVWRETLTSFEEIGASWRGRFNVVPEQGSVSTWRGAWITASSFRITGVAPVLGRPLLDADEVEGASDVVVLSHELWQSLYGGDPAAVGRTLRIAETPYTVVGVMPEGFLFPDREYLWIPLRGAASTREPGSGPEIWIYGRLADGVGRERAQAELHGVEAGLDEAFPDVYGRLRPEVVPYAYLSMGGPLGTRWILAPFQLLALLLLGVACGNVGTLILARNAARSGEVAVRTALGASRSRILSQLFVESLVLALLATGVGLALGQLAMTRFESLDFWQDELSFWIDFGLNRRTVAQALGLAVFCAAVAGLLPALRSTGRSVRGGMELARGGPAARFGGATTALVVAEVTLGVLCLFGGWMFWQTIPGVGSAPSDVPLERFLSVRLTISPQASSDTGAGPAPEDPSARLASAQRELMHRLEAEPGVGGTALARRLPGEFHPPGWVEVEDAPLTPEGHRVARAWVAPGFFEAFGQPIRGGRDFALSDLPAAAEEESSAVVVNVAFVERVLGGGNAIGRRLRYVPRGDRDPGPWYQIVGVVGSLGMLQYDPMPDDAGLYHVAAPDALVPARIAIRAGADPMAFLPRLREIAAGIDPWVVVDDAEPLTEILADTRALTGWLLFAVGLVAGIAVVLSVASLYALMSFTVARRTHEIGLRSALGADPASIVSVIVKRAVKQLVLGVGIAVTIATVVVVEVMPGPYGAIEGWLSALAASAGVVLLVGLAACIVPTRRGLRIQPMEALRI